MKKSLNASTGRVGFTCARRARVATREAPGTARSFRHAAPFWRVRHSVQYGQREAQSCPICAPQIKGSVGAEHAFSGTSWAALTLEVGKSPTQVTCGRHVPRSPFRRRFASSLRSSSRRAVADPPEPCGSRQRALHGEQDPGARARPALGACATRPGHAVNMLAEERRCASDTLAQHPCSSTAVRATAGSSATQSLRALKPCVPLAPSQPHSRRVMAEHM